MSTCRPRRASRGFSLLELVIVIALVSLLLAIAVDRLLLVKARAESMGMEQVVGTLRSAMTIRVAELVARARVAEVATLAGTDPMRLLAERPRNYLGELFGPDASTLQVGNWFYDLRDHALCYLVESSDYFQSTLSAPPRACFAVEPVFDDANGNNRYDPGVDTLRGLRLAAIAPYEWRLQFVWPDWPWAAPKAASRAAR